MRIYNNFYLFIETVVSPTAVGEEKGRDGSGILGASREVVESRGDTTAASWVRRGWQWGAGERWRLAMLGRNIFNKNYYTHI
jgi:hypothetical protein